MGRPVDRARETVDVERSVPRRVPHAPCRLWEPGDTTGTTIGLLTCDDVLSSTIHSPYYFYYQL
jgi:hypothetical protein